MRCSRLLELGVVHVGRPGEARRGSRGCGRRCAARPRSWRDSRARPRAGSAKPSRRNSFSVIAKTSRMSRVSRSPTLMPTGLASTSRDIRAVDFTAIAAAIQAPKRNADHQRLLEVERVHGIEIEIGEVVDGRQRRRQLGAAEAGMRRRDQPAARRRAARAPAPTVPVRCGDGETGSVGRGRGRSARALPR